MNPAAFFASVRASLFLPMTQGQVDGCNALLIASKAMPLTWRAYLFATVYRECDRTMRPITEYGGPSYFAKYDAGTTIGKRLGNTQPGDGARFKGRGYVQLTGRGNYTRAALETGADMIGNPELALDTHLAAQIAVQGMVEGWFTGKGFKDYLTDAKTDYRNARRIINGTDDAALIAGYAGHFESALKAST